MQHISLEEGARVALPETHLAMIIGSCGTELFQSLYVEDSDDPRYANDVIQQGDVACALFASALMVLEGLIEGGIRTTVPAYRQALLASGWTLTDRLWPGAPIFWGPKPGGKNGHTGFYVGKGMAVSNIPPPIGTPQLHPLTFSTSADGQPIRPVTEIYWRDLNQVYAQTPIGSNEMRTYKEGERVPTRFRINRQAFIGSGGQEA